MTDFGTRIFAPLVRGLYFFGQIVLLLCCCAAVVAAIIGIFWGCVALIEFHWAFSFLFALPVFFFLMFKWGQKGIRDGKRSVFNY